MSDKSNEAKTEAESKKEDRVANPPTVSSVQSDPKPFNTFIDTTSKIFQIVALFVAGIWAWSVFQMTVKPSLESKFSVSSELHWAVVEGTKDVCQASFQVKVKNAGKTPFEIADKATVRVWLIDLKKNGLLPPNNNKPVFLDPVEVQKQAPFYDGDGRPISADLTDHYPEGFDSEGSFQMFFRKQPNTILVFYAKVEGSRPTRFLPKTAWEDSSNYTYQVDQICGANWDQHSMGNQVKNPLNASK